LLCRQRERDLEYDAATIISHVSRVGNARYRSN